MGLRRSTVCLFIVHTFRVDQVYHWCSYGSLIEALHRPVSILRSAGENILILNPRLILMIRQTSFIH